MDFEWKRKLSKNSEQFNKKENSVEQIVKQNIATPPLTEIIPENLFSEIKIPNPIPALETKKIENQNSSKESHSDEIDKIVIFYKNGTFKSYIPD